MKHLLLTLSAAAVLAACGGGGGDSPQDSDTFDLAMGTNNLRAQVATLGGVANVVIGGGGRNCSSFNGDTQSSNCAADWTTILAQDPAFAGLSKADISFDGNYVFPTVTYGLNQAALDRLAAVPAILFDATRKATVTAALQNRLQASGAQAGLSFAQLDGSNPLFADGDAFWFTSDIADFDAVVTALCGKASPVSGDDCVISDATIAAVQSLSFVVADDRDKVVLILRDIQSDLGGGSITIKYRRLADGTTASPNLRGEFIARKLAADGSDFAAGVSDGLTTAEIAILRSAFADSPAPTRRKVEARTVKFLSNEDSRTIYLQIVEAARVAGKKQRPVIGVVTASADNAYFDADINVTALRSAGADVVYIPLSGGLRRAIDANDCANLTYRYDAFANTGTVGTAFHMDLAYPDFASAARRFCDNGAASLNDTLRTLDGVYFSGGDQARHLEALASSNGNGAFTVVSEQLRILRERFQAGALVVAGTSAGNHAQGGGVWKGKPVPMVGGGDSYPALLKGFVAGAGAALEDPTKPNLYADGGLGFFRFGVLDSHFSRRTRESRLVRATIDTGMDYGFGVDENTALLVGRTDARGRTRMGVSGEGGVFIVDVRGAAVSGANGGTWQVDGVKAHYLTEGDTLEIDANGELSLQFARRPTEKPLLPIQASAAIVTQDRVQDYGSSNFLKMARAMGVGGAPLAFGTTANSADGRNPQATPLYGLTLRRGADTVFRGSEAGGVSYGHVRLSIAPCGAGGCVTPTP